MTCKTVIRFAYAYASLSVRIDPGAASNAPSHFREFLLEIWEMEELLFEPAVTQQAGSSHSIEWI